MCGGIANRLRNLQRLCPIVMIAIIAVIKQVTMAVITNEATGTGLSEVSSNVGFQEVLIATPFGELEKRGGG